MKTQFYTNNMVECGSHPAAGKPTKRRKEGKKKMAPAHTNNFTSPDSCPIRGFAGSYLRQTPAP